jgi:hypothetical protein
MSQVQILSPRPLKSLVFFSPHLLGSSPDNPVRSNWGAVSRETIRARAWIFVEWPPANQECRQRPASDALGRKMEFLDS